MPEYGWAYVNLDALKTISGGTGSITFKTDDTNVSGTSILRLPLPQIKLA